MVVPKVSRAENNLVMNAMKGRTVFLLSLQHIYLAAITIIDFKYLVIGSVATLPLNRALSASPMARHAAAEWIQSACEPRMLMTSL